MRLLVVEDHPIYRDGLVAVLSTVAEVEAVTLAGTVAEATASLDQSLPDVAVVDLALPDGSGLEVIRKAAGLGVAVLVLTMSHEPANLVRAVEAGARGYVVKGAGRTDLVAALHSVLRGDVVLGAEVAAVALDVLSRGGSTSNRFPTLSERERQIMELLGLGLPNRAIATRLSLSEKTVRNYVSAILAKLEVNDRHEAGDLARRSQ